MDEKEHKNRICKRCLMDSSARSISFDTKGYCNYCSEFAANSSKVLSEAAQIRNSRLEVFVNKVKNDGKGKKYDCVVGVSGGLDSSMVLVHAKKLGLRPLAVHMDNGWNSELAQNNIANLVKKLEVDLHTTVIDWSEYRELMQAFFDADVIDVELLYDNAMTAVNYRQAAKYGVRYILAGTNLATEGMKIPLAWNWFKLDKRNIKGIARISGIRKFKSFPSIGTREFIWYNFIRKVSWVSFLDYTEYEKERALETLTTEFDYRPYPYKHYESIFTRFYQGVILPKKFNVDKRRVHLSNLIMSNQLQRSEGINILKQSTYVSEEERNSDMNYFIKKMDWSIEEFNDYLARPEVRHDYYPSERNLYHLLLKVYKRLKNIK